MTFNALTKPVVFLVAILIVLLVFVVVPIMAGESIGGRLKTVTLPSVPKDDSIREAFNQINARIKDLQEEKHENLTQHRIFTQSRRRDTANIKRFGYKIWGNMVISDGNIVQVNFYWFFTRSAEELKKFGSGLGLQLNEGYIFYFDKDGTLFRYLEGEFSALIEKIHQPEIALIHGIEIEFHKNGIPSSYKTIMNKPIVDKIIGGKPIEETKQLGRLIEWDEEGKVISDIGTDIPMPWTDTPKPIPEPSEKPLATEEENKGKADTSELRPWRSADGTQEVRATFVSVEGTTIFLTREDGTAASVEMSQLSVADQEYVKQRLAAENNEEKKSIF
jgi:hypothetical protein